MGHIGLNHSNALLSNAGTNSDRLYNRSPRATGTVELLITSGR